MPAAKRNRVTYRGREVVGVYYIDSPRRDGKSDKVFYIHYKRGGKPVEEPAGRESEGMTPGKAKDIRDNRLKGRELSNREQREVEKAAKAAEEGRWTIDKLWTEYVSQRRGGKADLTDKANYKNHLKPSFGGKEPGDIDALSVDRLRVRLLKDHQPATAVKVLGLLKRIVRFGARRQLCPALPFPIAMPQVNNQRTESLTNDQMARYIKTCREWPDKQAGNYQLFILLTGFRRGEARGLEWTDVDFSRGFLRIRDPKGGRDQDVAMSGAVRDLLESHPKEPKSPHVFSGVRGKGPRGNKQIAETARKIRDKAELPRSFRPNHGLRHAFASHLASSGEVDLYTIQRLLTHKSPMMTQRYSHLRDEALRRGADVMGRLATGEEETA
jgi:integrase